MDQTQRNAAKIAGLFYLLTAAAVVYANFGIHGRLGVQKIAANERLFRIGVALDLFYCIGIVAVIAALYVLLRPVSQTLALLSTFWKLVYALAWVVMSLHFYDALRLVKGAEYLQAFDAGQLQSLARLYLSSRFDRYYGGLLFYALGGTISSWLFFKTTLIPKVLSAIGIASFAWCSFCALAFLIDPRFSNLVNLWAFDTPMALFEIVMSAWLLFKGFRP